MKSPREKRSSKLAPSVASEPPEFAPRVVVLVDTATGWGRNIVRGVATYSHHHGPWHLWVEPHGAAERIRPPRNWRGEGIIARVSSVAMSRQLAKYKVPIVNVSGIRLPGINHPRVTNDLAAASQMAADHFLKRGFRSFGYVGWKTFTHVRQHYRAFADAVGAQGYECPLFPLGARHSSAIGWQRQQSLLRDWLLELPKPLAVFCWSHQGLAVLDACTWARLHVPEQVAVLSGDDDDVLYPACSPPLSGVVQSGEQIGRLAAETLHGLIRGEKDVAREILVKPTHLVERVSTDTLAVTDPDVAMAVRYIRENAAHGIHVDDVAGHVALSRRSLERKFELLLSHSPADELRRVRVARALMLLSTSTLSIPQVAEMSGFGSGMYLAHVVRKDTGMTPLQYRNTHRITTPSPG